MIIIEERPVKFVLGNKEIQIKMCKTDKGRFVTKLQDSIVNKYDYKTEAIALSALKLGIERSSKIIN